VCNAAAAAVEVHSAVDAAAAMQSIVSGWTNHTNRITVDPQAGCVSHQQRDNCVIFSLGGGPLSRVQFVKVKGLPPSFIDVQEVRGNARGMNPDQNTILLPLTAPAISPLGPSRKIRAESFFPTDKIYEPRISTKKTNESAARAPLSLKGCCVGRSF
jgi:hypothetical protein